MQKYASWQYFSYLVGEFLMRLSYLRTPLTESLAFSVLSPPTFQLSHLTDV